jgi:DNA mismatch endonuclease (patch repair protein)
MVDILSPDQRTRVMSRIKGKNTTPERYIRSLLRAGGLRFRQHDRTLAGCPDFIFPEAKVAVFVNGDFWHGWRFPIWRHKLRAFWRNKIGGNRERDRRTFRMLRRLGWNVLRIWEHQVETDVVACVQRIARATGRNSLNLKSIRRQLRRMPPLRRRNRLPKP